MTRRRLLLAALASAAFFFPLGSSLAQEPAAPANILLQADQIVYDGDNQTVAATGHVEIVDQGRVLNADSVTYDQKSDKVTASGHVSLTDSKGNVAFADHVELTDRMRDGALSGFGALIGKNGRLAAANAQRTQDRFVIANKAVYSACKICNQPGQRTPLWEVKSERVIFDQEKHRIHFENATVNVLGVPLLYTPFLSEPDPTVKYASGFLAPDLGNSTKIGYFARLPFYLALSPTNDMTVAPQFSTLGGDLMEVEYRARWNNSGLWFQGSGAYNPDGGLAGPKGTSQGYDHLFGAGRIALNDTWRIGFDVQLTNNHAYMRYYDISYLDRLVNDIFLEDDFGRSRFFATGYYFQGLRSSDFQRTIPFVLPEVQFNYIPTVDVMGGQFRFDFSSVMLERDQGPDSRRVTAQLDWRLPLIFGAGQLWTLVADARGDFYHISNNDVIAFPAVPAKTFEFTRGIPYVALDWRWPFIAQSDARRSYLLEPLAQVIVQPYGGNPAGLPIKDTNSFELDDNNIFSFNQFPGYYLVESGPRANVGFIAKALYPGGEVEALLGQTYRLKPDPVFSTLTGQNGTQSDIVARVTVKFPHLDFTDRMDFDRGNGTVRRHEVYVTGSYGRSSVQLNYLELPPSALTQALPSRQQVSAQADINFYQNWQAFAAIERNLATGTMLDTEYGLGYEDECLAIALAYRKKFTSDSQGLPEDTAVVLRFSLKTGDQPVKPFSLFPRNVFNSSSHP